MQKIFFYSVLCSAALLLSCCSDNDDAQAPDVPTYTRGTFTDARDGNSYGYVTIGNLDWTTENSRYDTGSDDTRRIYSTKGTPSDDTNLNDQKTLERYGYLYSWKGAQEAVPEGWRLPTDADWQQLEEALGMSADEAQGDAWRGSYQGQLLADTRTLGLGYGGFYDANSTSFAIKFYFMQAMGYYWTATSPSDGVAYIRKIMYNNTKVYRHTSKTNNMMSVRFVRDHQ